MQKRWTRETLKLYFNETRRYWPWFLFLIATVAVTITIDTVVPLFYKQFFDLLGSASGATSQTVQSLWSIIVVVTVFHGISWALWRCSGFAANIVVARIMTDLYQSAYNYLQHHSYGFFSNHFVGSLVKRATRYSNSYGMVFNKACWDLYPLAIRIIGILIVLATVRPLIALILGAWVLIFLALNYAFAVWKLKYDIARAAKDSETTAVLADAITNATNIRLFHGFHFELDRFRKVTEEGRSLRLLTWNLGDIVEGMQAGLMIIVELALMVVALRFWQRGMLTIGTFVLIQTYLTQLFGRLWDFGRVVRDFYEALAEAEEMTVILKTPHEINDTPTAKLLQLPRGEIEFRDVSFSYNKTRKVLHNINLTLRPGEKVALIGPSGSGKSTLVKLLFRLYDIDCGKILIDGQKIHTVTQESLHQALSLVPQDPILFHRTLMENIRYGRRDATDDEVIAAAKLAHCHEFIESFPDTYHTYVGERGIKLSGGERQRVAIARAILRNSPFLVLDEATSSLDSYSESLIQDALITLMKEKTTIVIAHRLSTIQQMDRIVVLDEGRIIEEGTHDTLLKREGSMYRKLWKIQVGGFLMDERAEEDPEATMKAPEAGEEESDDENPEIEGEK